MRQHRYTLEQLRHNTRRDAERGYIYTMPDGVDWLLTERKEGREWVGTFLQPDLEYLADRHAEAKVFYRYSTKSRDSRGEGRVYPSMEAALRADGGASFEDGLRDGLRFGLTPWCWFYKQGLSAGPHLDTQDKVQLINFLGAAIRSKPASLNV